MTRGFSYYFCLMIEVSGSGSGFIPYLWPKTLWIRRIRILIRNTACRVRAVLRPTSAYTWSDAVLNTRFSSSGKMKKRNEWIFRQTLTSLRQGARRSRATPSPRQTSTSSSSQGRSTLNRISKRESWSSLLYVLGAGVVDPDPHWLGRPGSGSVLGMRNRIQEHWNWIDQN